ncbi:MAG: tetraacyldisaccharide 4'-kinase [Sulfuricella sp.]|nr:tetraacyldisaccharide 4'-kinase [Sulfuricella sp.]
MTPGKPARRLEKIWYGLTPLHVLLLPPAILFRLAAALRRACYRAGLLRSVRLAVPVIVVGNISVGGTGKTPLVLWLANFLRQQGRRPGIVSRGYGGSALGPVEIGAGGDPAVVGDEPLLLAGKSGCPVWVGRDRVAAAEALLRAHPECDVLVSDDGLQHYRLGRDVEVAVVDGERLFGNGLPLPAGPLRESVSRLDSVDAVVVNGGGQNDGMPTRNGFEMRLDGRVFYNLKDPARRVEAADFRGRKLHAVAGIGNPQRFFELLRGLGLGFEAHAFPDHYAYRRQDLEYAEADAVLMTEKDAVKCAGFADERFWVLAVEAVLAPAFGELILRKLRNDNGRQAA